MIQGQNFPQVTVILRGYNYESVRSVVSAMVGTKLRSVEITMNSKDAIETIKKIANEFKDEILVGAGTVLTYDQAMECIQAGVQFILSPVVLSKDILDLCKEHQVISVPGAFSPSEIWKSFVDGADIVKVFPAARLDKKYFQDIQAPLGKLPLMIVGGINGDNVQEYFDAGVSYAGIGSGIFNKQDIVNCDERALKKSIEEFETKVKWG
ncbi:bifunctional 4-hydroxy-2-oxoglutarate aldolase/2-dehydro-3-deoxy-phosphogluconate aldolase [Anaerorhabdus sp.]|uniref:bifunctional 4-hydroxy-2-oxoglutarate aldolase/2-dehydro-3-deoxy-phosphogluconate aldolase n=1 Tax=Anaerorhabdus sp. TaxID=1872524 RepID=UPI002B202275|nr:bifunctional 4-hydroxy-2-oxoglutarate aldolase/2-dehydro-3-deoxy-phosphogluconate aldolase [Anaerorhabdus sp.]MEA4873940.1 bifunctional 4-hydroxy-2-oxoglutarate aldolase/2-dehydro-3-deoxy-phosphogluconate aldolase [Anaerorhabdus sp.]